MDTAMPRDRVSQDRILTNTLQNMKQHGAEAERINVRIKALKKEWDIERLVEVNASSMAVLGIVLGYFVHAGWFVFSLFALIFLFQHGVQGWCPPFPIFRRLGKRTSQEIEEERHALKALRGDYENIKNPQQALFDAMKE